MFGRPGVEDVRALVRSLAHELEPDVLPHVSLADASGLERVDPFGFLLLSEYVFTNRVRLGQQVTRLAIVRPAGAIGATVAGFYVVMDPPYPVKVFEDRRAALRWLEKDTEFDTVLGDAIAEAAREPTLLRDVRRELESMLGGATLHLVARRLAMSSRTLQRRLNAAGTTFHREQLGVRMQLAERLLDETDRPVTTIAFECGFTSVSRFSAAFRRRTGLTPTEWRARARR